MEKYINLTDEDLNKIINSILTDKLVSNKRLGYKHMKTEDVVIEEGDA